MDEKQLEKLTGSINEKFDTLGNDIEKANGNIEKFEATVDEIRESLKGLADKEYAEKMQEHLDSMESKINDLATKGADSDPIDSQVDKFLKSDSYKSVLTKEANGANFIVKASTITTSNSFTQTNSPIIPYWREPGVAIDPRNPLILTQLVAKGVIGKADNIDWVERTSETDGTAATAEAAQFGQSDIGWTSYKLPVEKIGAYLKVSREKLEDTDFVRGEIMEALGYEAPNKQEYYMWNGTGSSNQLSGILGSATYNSPKTFSKPTGVNAVTSANEYDVLAAAILQIELGANSTNSQSSLKAGFMPNAIIVNPVDWYNMTRLKDNTNQYLVGMDGIMRVSGVPVYKSTRIAAGTYLVGDFNQAKLYQRRATEIRMWDQDSTDPEYDLVTFTVSNRACLKIGHSTTGLKNYAFVTGTFVAGISALTA